jgi:hypothetical protein
LLGNLILTNTSTGDGGTTDDRALSERPASPSPAACRSGEGSLPSVNINMASGTLTLPSILTVAGSNWTYTAAGTINSTANNSTVDLRWQYDDHG